MPASLAKMLGQKTAEFQNFVSDMEDKYGHPSHDVRLLSEVIAAVKQKIGELGLDPDDTTSRELYLGLRAKYQRDCEAVDKTLGVGPFDSFDQRLSRAIEIVKGAAGSMEAWSLKPSLAKELLRTQLPKKTAKLLGYRSIDSMFKRENIGRLYLLAPLAESPSWKTKFLKSVKRLPSHDYLLGPINFLELPVDKLGGFNDPPNLYVCNVQMAAIALWPSDKLASANVISLALLLVEAAGSIGLHIPASRILAIDPSLAWWSDTMHLLSAHDSPVSLNIHDVARNHRDDQNLHEGSVMAAAKALWSELESRYRAMSGELSEITEDDLSNLMPARLVTNEQEA